MKKFFSTYIEELKTRSWRKFYLSSEGRMTRLDYNLWCLLLIYGLNAIIAPIQDFIMIQMILDIKLGMIVAGSIEALILIGSIIMFIAPTNKRFHDRGKTGWYQARYILVMAIGSVLLPLSLFIDPHTLLQNTAQIVANPMLFFDLVQITKPFLFYLSVGLIIAPMLTFIIELCFLPGPKGTNKFGDDPRIYV